jgi:ATPase subunit of ABC transporter with duplicated ATPase domains
MGKNGAGKSTLLKLLQDKVNHRQEVCAKKELL